MALAGFLLLAVLAVAGALGVVLQRNALYGALTLVGVFATTAILYLMLSAPFLAAVQVMVYAGAIMVLFIFVIMLLSLRYEESGESEGVPRGAKRNLAVALSSILVALLVLLGTGLVLTGRPGPSEGNMASIRDLGLTLYQKYAFPFELASVLLLVAIVGAVALTRRHGRGFEGSVAREDT